MPTKTQSPILPRQRIAECWNEFAESTVSKRTSASQRNLMRASFYAGAQAILAHIMSNLSSEKGTPTSKDHEIFEDIRREIVEYAWSLLTERGINR